MTETGQAHISGMLHVWPRWMRRVLGVFFTIKHQDMYGNTYLFPCECYGPFAKWMAAQRPGCTVTLLDYSDNGRGGYNVKKLMIHDRQIPYPCWIVLKGKDREFAREKRRKRQEQIRGDAFVSILNRKRLAEEEQIVTDKFAMWSELATVGALDGENVENLYEDYKCTYEALQAVKQERDSWKLLAEQLEAAKERVRENG